MATSRVVAVKQIETAVHASYMVWIVLLPALAAYGAANGATPGYYFLLALLPLAATPAPAAAGSLVCLLLVRSFPARRLHQALSLVGVAGLSVIIALLRFVRPERLLDPRELEDLAALAGQLELPGAGALPPTWIARGLISAGDGDLGSLGAALAGVAALGLVLTALLQRTARRHYRRAWERCRVASAAPTPAARHRPRTAPILARTARALARKDLQVFFRDPSRWSQLLLLGALVVIYLFNIASLPTPPSARGLVAFVNLALTGFVLSAVALRFAYTAASLEGTAFGLLRSSPIGMGRYLAVKFATLSPLLLVLGLGLVYGSNRLLGVDRVLMAYGLFAVAMLSTGLVGMGIGLGSLWPRFRATNPAEAAGSAGGLLFMLISLGYIASVLLLLFRPLSRHLLQGVLPDAQYLPAHALSSSAGILALCIAATVLPLWAGARALARRDL